MIVKKTKNFYKAERKEYIECACGFCGVKFLRPKNYIKKTKSGLQFCSQGCSRKWYKMRDITRSGYDFSWIEDKEKYPQILFTQEDIEKANTPKRSSEKVLPVRCDICGKLFHVSVSMLYDLKSGKSKLRYCSRDCFNEYQREFHKAKRKSYGASRTSKHERYVDDLLKEIFPSIKYETYNRTIISPLELDFWFPDYRIAIELNGAQHYRNAFEKNNEKQLKKIRIHDKLKSEMAKTLGIKLLVIDTSRDFNFTNGKECLRAIIDFVSEEIGVGVDWNRVDEIVSRYEQEHDKYKENRVRKMRCKKISTIVAKGIDEELSVLG